MSKLNDLLTGVKSAVTGVVGTVATATVPEWVMIVAGLAVLAIIGLMIFG